MSEFLRAERLVRRAVEADFALGDQRLEHLDDPGGRRAVVGAAVEQVQVDAIGPEPAQRRLTRTAYVLRAHVRAGARARCLVEPQPELR